MIKTINYKPGKYDEKYMKIKFNSDDHLPFNKTLKLYNLDKYYNLYSYQICFAKRQQDSTKTQIF